MGFDAVKDRSLIGRSRSRAAQFGSTALFSTLSLDPLFPTSDWIATPAGRAARPFVFVGTISLGVTVAVRNGDHLTLPQSLLAIADEVSHKPFAVR
jgi:hypothetical protein